MMQIIRLKRKSQIAVFLITGIIILSLSMFFLFSKGNIVKKAMEREVKKVEDVNVDADQVKNYVESCIESIAGDGLIRIGQRGGFIDTEANIRLGDLQVIDAIHLVKGGEGYPIPYYYYDGELLEDNIRDAETIERHLERYIAAKFEDECNLEDFEAQGLEIVKPDIDYTGGLTPDDIGEEDFDPEDLDDYFAFPYELDYTTTKLDINVDFFYGEAGEGAYSDTVIVKFTYPLLIKNGDSATQVSDFEAELPYAMDLILKTIDKIKDDLTSETYHPIPNQEDFNEEDRYSIQENVCGSIRGEFGVPQFPFGISYQHVGGYLNRKFFKIIQYDENNVDKSLTFQFGWRTPDWLIEEGGCFVEE